MKMFKKILHCLLHSHFIYFDLKMSDTQRLNNVWFIQCQTKRTEKKRIHTTKHAASEPKFREILLNTHCKTHHKHSNKATLLLGVLAFIYFMNSCATQEKSTRECFGFVKG